MAGYDVWCDQQKLLGGEDFWKDIEAAIRSRAIKFILVVSVNAFDDGGVLRDGIAKELAVANIVKKQLDDEYFVIPVLIDETRFSDFPIEFVRLNGIDEFKKNWATGLSKLIKVLERDQVPCAGELVQPSMAAWRGIHQSLSTALSEEKEILQSNWLPIKHLPDQLHFYQILRVVKSAEPRTIASSCPLPCIEHGRLLVSFAGLEEMQTSLGEAVPVKSRGSLATSDFLKGRTGSILGILPHDARNKVSSLVRQAWDKTLAAKGLVSYEMANQRLAWWFPEGTPQDGQLRYTDYDGKSRRRAVQGTRGKKEGPSGVDVPRYYWHLGFTGKPVISEKSHIVLQPRIIISEDGRTPLVNKTKLNSVRRGVTKKWFNNKWRGLVLGFSAWLAGNGPSIELSAANDAVVRLGSWPVDFEIPVAISADPTSQIFSDEDEERMEREEATMRLNDPAFFTPDDDEDEE